MTLELCVGTAIAATLLIGIFWKYISQGPRHGYRSNPIGRPPAPAHMEIPRLTPEEIQELRRVVTRTPRGGMPAAIVAPPPPPQPIERTEPIAYESRSGDFWRTKKTKER